MRTRVCLIVVLLLGLITLPVGALTYTRVTVATTATLVFAAQNATVNRVLVRNPGSVSVYVGDVNVTTANGFEIAAGDSLAINLYGPDRLYGVVAAATQVVYTIQGSNPQ